MIASPPAGDEAARLAAIRRYDVLDTPEDGAFDRITALAARHFGVPIAIVSIVDRDRIWFKSHHGVDVREIGRDPGLCASAIMQDGPWVVEDAATDPRTLANPLVAGELGLRFYAGVPLATHDGHNLGTLCVIDLEPRELTAEETSTLADMAAIVMDELELRLASRQVVDREQQLRDQAEEVVRTLRESLLPPALPAIPGCELASLYLPVSTSEVGGDFYDVFAIPAGGWGLVIGDVSGKGPEAAAVTALARHAIRTAFLASADPVEVLGTLNRAMFIGLGDAGPRHFCTALVAAALPAADGLHLRIAAAGHPAAIRLARDGAAELTGAGGPPVGWHAEAAFTAVEARLDPGDALLLYTDGLSEARTAAGELFGSGWIAGVLEAGRDESARELAARIEAALRADGADVRDDVAALVVRVTP
jgi:sigma-B regulation protein RsbU (phosphoserine phosphatase)